jgi:hypothetical protein
MLISSIGILRSRCGIFYYDAPLFLHPRLIFMLYYMPDDQHFLGLTTRQLSLRYITHRMTNISSTSLLVSLYYVVLYAGWSTFPRHHYSSAKYTLYYIQDDQQFLGLIARQLILCCIIRRMINISSASLLVRWICVILHTEWSTFPRPHCSSAVTMFYYIQDDQHFLGLIARTSQESRMKVNRSFASRMLYNE